MTAYVRAQRPATPQYELTVDERQRRRIAQPAINAARLRKIRVIKMMRDA